MTKAKGGGSLYRNASSGQFTTKAAVAGNPKGTTTETRGGGSTHGAHRSAISGKFVGRAAAARWPDKSIKDS